MLLFMPSRPVVKQIVTFCVGAVERVIGGIHASRVWGKVERGG